MSRTDRFAILLSLLGVLAAYLVADRVFEGLAHLEDEVAYVWQAQALAGGALKLPSPPEPKSFLVPFVVDYNGYRFGKYPPGWPAVLAVGELLDLRTWVNPLLAGLAIWLTYRLGRRVLNPRLGLLAAGLTLVSPFFLLNSGSLLSHPLGLVLSSGFALTWLAATSPAAPDPGAGGRGASMPGWLWAAIAGLCLGWLALTRPLTAVGVGLPFAIHGLYLLWRGDTAVRRRVAAAGAIALGLGMFVPAWQYAMTGDPLLNPYTLWWPYDRLGFGPGHGVTENGHTLKQAYFNTRRSLPGGFGDLFGWWKVSWIFLPFGLWAARRNKRLLLLASVFPSLVLVYLAYWIGSWLFGPRYYYEGLYSLTLLSAAGIAWLAGWPLGTESDPSMPSGALNQSSFRSTQSGRLRQALVLGFVAILVAYNLAVYLPPRLQGMVGLYSVRSERLEPFLSPAAQQYAPALIVVHTGEKWIDYGTLLELSNPFLDTPFIFIVSRGSAVDQAVIDSFPERKVFHYYPDQPYTFYNAPRLTDDRPGENSRDS